MKPRLALQIGGQKSSVQSEWGVYPNPTSIPNTTDLQSQEGSLLPLVILKFILVHGLGVTDKAEQGLFCCGSLWQLFASGCQSTNNDQTKHRVKLSTSGLTTPKTHFLR